MPRQARTQSPTEYYHVMMLGNNRESIFVTDEQKRFFLDCLKKQEADHLINIVAYCLMNNNIHIVVNADLINLAKAVKSTNTISWSQAS